MKQFFLVLMSCACSFLVMGCDDGDRPPAEWMPPPPTECVWPEGTVGLENGQMMEAGVSWFGFAPGEETAREIRVEELYDCDGTHGIDGLLFTTSKYQCSRCAREADELEELISGWEAEGLRIEVITLLINNDSGERDPDEEACQTWINEHHLENVWVVGDPTVTFFSAGRFATPMRSVVNPRTMQIQEIVQGNDPYTTLEPTARANRPEWLPLPETPDAGAAVAQ